MGLITVKGSAQKTSGELPTLNSKAPDFTLTNTELKEIKLQDFTGKRLILNVFPSLDTSTCAASVRMFNQAAAKLENTLVLCISMDLPFAMKRFCENEGLKNVVSLSAFRHPEFGQAYGLTLCDSALAGLLSRAVIVLDDTSKVIYTEQVQELSHEPDYAKVLAIIVK